MITERGTVRGRRAIIAIPPALAGRIEYEPGLSADRDQLTQAVPMGSVMKFFAFYSTPFWRSAGLNAQAVSTKGRVFATFDNTHPDGKMGALLGFAVGPRAEELRRLSAEERRRVVLDQLRRLFGPEAATPVDFVEHSWAEEPWARGGYLGYLGPGVWTTLGPALRRPEGRLHWAGTETAREWNGYIEGAIESGERAAGEVLAGGT